MYGEHKNFGVSVWLAGNRKGSGFNDIGYLP